MSKKNLVEVVNIALCLKERLLVQDYMDSDTHLAQEKREGHIAQKYLLLQIFEQQIAPKFGLTAQYK